MKKIFVLICVMMFAVVGLCGCSKGGFIPDRQGNQIEYVLIQDAGNYWNKYNDIKSYHFYGDDIIVITFNNGEQVITHCENVIIKLKGE